MTPLSLNILFLGSGNSARSIFAEYLIRKLGKGKFTPHSAGINPEPEINPYVIRVLNGFTRSMRLMRGPSHGTNLKTSPSISSSRVPSTPRDKSRLGHGQAIRSSLIGPLRIPNISRVPKKTHSTISGKSPSSSTGASISFLTCPSISWTGSDWSKQPAISLHKKPSFRRTYFEVVHVGGLKLQQGDVQHQKKEWL